jgi:hypothetical protein
VKELNEMTIGRTDDPENPFGAPAFEAADVFGSGSRIPSGPAVIEPHPKGRTHDRNRPARQNSHFPLASEGPSTHGTPKSLTVWLPLTDATPLNGCVYVVPADRDPTYNTPDEQHLRFELSDIRALPAAAGSLLAWTQGIIHWGARTAPRQVGPRISLSSEFQRRNVAPSACLCCRQLIRLPSLTGCV